MREGEQAPPPRGMLGTVVLAAGRPRCAAASRTTAPVGTCAAARLPGPSGSSPPAWPSGAGGGGTGTRRLQTPDRVVPAVRAPSVPQARGETLPSAARTRRLPCPCPGAVRSRSRSCQAGPQQARTSGLSLKCLGEAGRVSFCPLCQSEKSPFRCWPNANSIFSSEDGHHQALWFFAFVFLSALSLMLQQEVGVH